MVKTDYTVLMYVREEGQICDTPDGQRVFVMERSKRDHFDRHDEGYPISRATLEYCVGWGVEDVHIYTSEGETQESQYVFDINDYLNAQFKPVFDDEFSTAPLTGSSP